MRASKRRDSWGSMTPFHTHPALAHPSIAHGFFGREGGVSTGIYASLNCGPGSRDDAAAVRENRRRVSVALGFDAAQLCSLYQDHTADAMVVEAPLGDERPRVDGFATRTPGILLGILTADCAPVLFADATAGVVAAAHAGWKGAFTGIIEHTVAAMESLGATRPNIQAVVGPCIAQPSYEVGPEFVARLVEADAANAQFFIPSPFTIHHSLFDLPAYVLARCAQAGLRQAQWIGLDTRPDDSPFFSYRRKTINGEPDYGRQISAIGIRR